MCCSEHLQNVFATAIFWTKAIKGQYKKLNFIIFSGVVFFGGRIYIFAQKKLLYSNVNYCIKVQHLGTPESIQPSHLIKLVYPFAPLLMWQGS